MHFNVFLDGVHIDPFAAQDRAERSLWLGGGDPLPAPSTSEPSYKETRWNDQALARTVADCTNASVRQRLENIADQELLAAELLYQTAYYPTRFAQRRSLYSDQHERAPLLSLPFSGDDFIGVHYRR